MEHLVSDFLVNTWAAILTLMLTMYVVLDGFDLGIGILSLLEKDKTRKIMMMESLNGIWDANETWLVLMGGTLFGAFPLAYSAVLQSLYFPALMMLFALMFRGVAFEFRLYAPAQQWWVFAFGAGSLLAALAQGFFLGSLLGGIQLPEAGFPVEIFAWLSPFSGVSALLLVTFYLVLGSTYLLRKVEGAFLNDVYRWAWFATLALILLLPVFIYGCAESMPEVWNRWSRAPLNFIVIAACIDVSLLMLMVSLIKRNDYDPFLWSTVSLIQAILALVASYYPYLVPGSMTLHHAASSTRTLEFMLMAVGGLLPLMLGYNAYQYYVFRGRANPDH